ncbi:N-acetylglucosamine-6-phosphate deacetylase [Lachnospiraceae bacterium KHCPX20]|nr:N-acetylglucosamine-6-phosphate deacetylase [Lachnospiraceae bacterium KHCPX20]
MKTKIINGIVYTKEDRLLSGEVWIEDGVIVNVMTGEEQEKDAKDFSGAEVIDATGHYVLPGFVDVHSHGAVGHDFCDEDMEGLKEILAYEKRMGVTSYCPTSMTFPEEKLSRVFAQIPALMEEKNAAYARVLGINMEGPFISPNKVGAQNPDYVMQADAAMFRRLNAISGNAIRLVTIAPEVEGNMDVIREIGEEVHVSVGHTVADYDQATDAFTEGSDHVTHLFNAMPPLAHRDPGVAGAAADQKHVYAEVICDLIHIHPSMIRRIYDMFGAERIVLISDSMEATGMEDGLYQLGGQEVKKEGPYARLSDGTIAGSVTCLFDGFKNAVKAGIPLESAIRMVTKNPAQSIGMDDQVGVIREGNYADLILVDRELNLVKVL